MSVTRKITVAACALLVSAAGAVAQATPPPAPATAAPARAQPLVEPKLVFDREVFLYAGQGRRDPFAPLQGTDAAGPIFEDLTIRGIFLSPVPTQSMAIINDANKKTYAKRLGDVIGNARIIGIEKTRVRFAVQTYGITREEILNLAPRASVDEIRAAQAAQAAREGADAGARFQQEMLRLLRGDTSRATPPAARPDTTRRNTPAGRTPPPVRRDTMESMR
jgi:hypothetical protein